MSVSNWMDIANQSWYKCTQCHYKTPKLNNLFFIFKTHRMACTHKSKKMTDAPLDFWDDVDEGTPPSTTSGGSSDMADITTLSGSSGRPAVTKKIGSDLDTIAPLFFMNSCSDGSPFVTKLKEKGIQTMAAIFAMGSYKANSLYSAFGERELIPQIAMMQTLANYVRSNMPKLVDTPVKCSKLE